MGIPAHLTCLPRNLFAGQEATVRTGHGTAFSKLGKEYVKAICCHLAYLVYMQSTSCKMMGWMKHKLESRLPGRISILSDMQMMPPLWQKAKKNMQWLKCRFIFHLKRWRDNRIPYGDSRESHSSPPLLERGPHILLTHREVRWVHCFKRWRFLILRENW